MKKSVFATVDAGADTVVWRDFVVKGTSVADQLSLSILLNSSTYVPNDLLGIYASLAGLGGHDLLTSTIRLENQNNVYDPLSAHPNETIFNAIDGGTGNDSITGTIFLGLEWGTVNNVGKGRDGNDTIKLSILAGESDSEWGTLAANTAIGGSGNDIISVLSDLDQLAGAFGQGVTHLVRGGTGTDTITSDVKLFLNDGTDVSVTIFGNEGADVILAKQQLDEGDFDSTTQIFGGSGNDRIEAQLGSGFGGTSGQVLTSIFGDSGDDTIMSRFINGDPDADAWFETVATLAGGTGNDRITSLGGDAGDRNTFIGGTGNDRMTGDGSIDEFVFFAGVNEGIDVIHNWDGSMDLLNISGQSNAQIDAQSTIASVGADVVLTLDSGTVITFKNVGLAGVDSVSDLFWTGV